MFAALERFEPETGKRARAAEKNKDPAAMKKILLPALSRAALRAPDADLVAFRDGMYQIVEAPAGINRKRCVEYAVGGGLQSQPTREEQLQIANTMTRFFEAAAAHPGEFTVDVQRAQAVNEQMLKTVDPQGMLDPARTTQLTNDQGCDLYVAMMRFLQKLPPAEAAHLIRAKMTASTR